MQGRQFKEEGHHMLLSEQAARECAKQQRGSRFLGAGWTLCHLWEQGAKLVSWSNRDTLLVRALERSDLPLVSVQVDLGSFCLIQHSSKNLFGFLSLYIFSGKSSPTSLELTTHLQCVVTYFTRLLV